MRLLASGPLRVAALTAVVAALTAGGIAYAAIPDGNGVIHGCWYEIVRASTMDPPNTETIAQAACPTGKKVLGGAASVQGVPTGVWLHTQVTSFGSFSAYDVIAINTTAETQQINATAICANVDSDSGRITQKRAASIVQAHSSD